MIEIRNLNKSFDNNEILKSISMHIKDASISALLGVSGSGKSTLLHCISGIEKVDSGEIILNNKMINYKNKAQLQDLRKHDIGIIFQNFNLLSKCSVYEQLYFTSNAKDEYIDDVLKQLEIYKLKHKIIEKCSGGEQQRVAIARAIVKRPKVILADEPTANLDASLALSSLSLLKQMAKTQNISIIMATHDKRVLSLCDCIFSIESGHIKQ